MPSLSAPSSASVSFTSPNGYLTVDCTSGAVANVSWVSPGGLTGSRVVRNTSDDIGPFPDNTVATVQCVSGTCSYQSSVSGGGSALGVSLGQFLEASGGEFGAAIQAAHDSLGPDGGLIVIPPSNTNYQAATTASFTKPVKILGCGVTSSEILVSTAGLVVIQTTRKLDVTGCGFTAVGAAVGNCTFIKFLSGSSGHGGSTISENRFDGASKCLHSLRTNGLVVENNDIHASNGYGLHLENTINPDEGDSFVQFNRFATDATSVNVFVESTSGINFTGNKFNGNSVGHVLIQAANVPLGNFIFDGGSMEGQTAYAIKAVATGSGVITKILIDNVQFSSMPTAANVIVGSNVINTKIASNSFNTTSASGGTGVKLLQGSKNTSVINNAFHAIAIGIDASGITNAGQQVHGNTFAIDVAAPFLGVADFDTASADADVVVVDNSVTASNTTPDYAVKVSGYGVVNVAIVGIVQGVGYSSASAQFLLAPGSFTQIGSTTYIGPAFDLAATFSGGYLLVGAKRNGATGTSVTMMVTVRAAGMLSEVRRY